MSEQETERQILMVMRQVLTRVIRDTTPPMKAMQHPLSEGTIEDIRQCLGLIAARERELADLAGAVVEKPHFTDEPRAAKVVPIAGIGRRERKDGED
jgi:hypothetical protein